MKIVAVIPTLGRRPELVKLTKQLITENVDTLVLGCPGENLHHLWNRGAQMARDWRHADYIAILNDDIVLPPTTLAYIAQTMQDASLACAGVDPEAPFGIAQDAKAMSVTGSVERLMLHVTTWCFVVKASDWHNIDEQYEWWWGVGDLFVKIQQAGGRLGQIKGLGISHVGSGTAKDFPWTEAAKLRDATRWRKAH
jgi:hypothetical protein